MKISVVKQLVADYSLEELKAAEEAISEEQTPSITIEGGDEGEQLTHVFAAVWVKEKIATENIEFRLALREYTKMVRKSIG